MQNTSKRRKWEAARVADVPQLHFCDGCGFIVPKIHRCDGEYEKLMKIVATKERLEWDTYLANGGYEADQE